MAERDDPRRGRDAWDRGAWEERERDEEFGPEREEREEVYGPYGRLDRSRAGISVRARNAGRRMDLFGTGRSGFGTTWGGFTGRRRSYTSSGAGGETAAPVSYAGRGPRGWHRSDERILEDVNERLTDDPEVDASDIEVAVADGEVTLSGTVENRQMKRLAEDIADEVSGVREVHNRLRVAAQPDQATGTTGAKQPGGITNR